MGKYIFVKHRRFAARGLFLAIAAALLAGCVPPANTNANATNTNPPTTVNANTNANTNNAGSSAANNNASPLGDDETLTPEQVESGRMDAEWKKYAQVAAPTEKPNPAASKENWGQISAEGANRPPQLPLSGDVSGDSVLHVQVLLDRADFSPGIIDGKWGKNTESAVYWLQTREGLNASGQVDHPTYDRLVQLAGNPDKVVSDIQLTADDVKGPFVKIPSNIYEKAKMDCMCYESLTEKFSEKFHVSPALLQKLNPKVNLDGLKAGDSITTPEVRTGDVKHPGEVAKLEVSDGGHYVHALDAQGKLLAHYPSTLGSDYNPSPTGDYKINSITENPWWNYQPALLDGGGGANAMIPPGPNNAVGVVWMDLSKPHYGIHGTSAPETIGYVTSHGCVRLTNWDALELGRWVQKGTPVSFRDTTNRSGRKEVDE